MARNSFRQDDHYLRYGSMLISVILLSGLLVQAADLAPLRPAEPRADLQAAAEYAGLATSALTVSQVAAQLGVDPSRIRRRVVTR